jgi:hypothetical protein
LGAPAHRVDGAALTLHGAVGIALAEGIGGIAHRFVGVCKIIAAVALLALLALLPALPALTLLALLALLTFLALLVLAEPALLHLVEQFAELLAQRLLVLP